MAFMYVDEKLVTRRKVICPQKSPLRTPFGVVDEILSDRSHQGLIRPSSL